MSIPHPLRLSVLAFVLAAGFGAGRLASAPEPAPASASLPATSTEAAFLAENDAAMTQMMNDMAERPTGDIDRSFARMMTPPHQGAIDMARAVLRSGRNELLLRIAQEIVVEQMQEIAAMRMAIGGPPPASGPVPTQPTAA